MNPPKLIDSLENFVDVLQALLRNFTVDRARWKPDESQWSILEVVCHLADEEVEDFRQRLNLCLNNPELPWPGIDPPSWVAERRYNEKDLSEALMRFTTERHASIRWLSGLESPDWMRSHSHPSLGEIRAGDLLLSWAVHDHLHLQQISRRLVQIRQLDGGPFGAGYALP